MKKYIYVFYLFGIIGVSTFYILSLNGADHKKAYHGIDITSKVELQYKNGSIYLEILRINESNLDGFWTNYSIDGRMSRTQFYFHGILDTTWYYNEDKITFHYYSKDYNKIHYADHDTSMLYHYLFDKISNIEVPAINSMVIEENQSFLDISIRRSYKTHLKNGLLDREILFTNNENFDGFWCLYDWQGLERSTVIVENKIDTTLMWWNDRLAFEEVDEFSDFIIVVKDNGNDSMRIVNAIQSKLN